MDGQLNGCMVALLVADGIHAERINDLRKHLSRLGARIHFISLQDGPVVANDGARLAVDASVGGISPRYYDGLLLPDCGSIAQILDVDETAVALLQVFIEEQRPVAAIGNGVALIADAANLDGRRIAARGEIRTMAEEAGGVPSDEEIVSDRLLTTGVAGCDIEELVSQFADDIHAMRVRDAVEEMSDESFPASDAHSGSSASHVIG